MKSKKLLFFILCLCAIVSCKKTDKTIESDEPIPITSQSAKNQIEYANIHLKQITEDIATLAKEKDFVSFVQTEAKKKFDGEYEVLIQDLQKNNTWREKMNLPKINNALNAFKNIDGSNYYPQVYIPKFQHEEDMKEEKNHTPSTTNLNQEQIVYIYYSGNSEVDSATNENDSYAGYVLDSSNNLVYWGMVNEEYANDNEVWIISMNESVGNGGNYCLPEFIKGANQYCPESLGGCCSGGGGGGGGGGGTPPCSGPDCDPFMEAPTTIPFPELNHYKVNCKIQNMVVLDGKESWLAGKSEVSIRAKLHCHNNRTEGMPYPAASQDYRSDQYSNLLGKLIRKFSRREIRRGTQVNVNYALQTNWQAGVHLQDPVYFDFVIFERDIWPAKIQRRTWNGREDRLQAPGGFADPFKLDFRSGGESHQDQRQFEYIQASIYNTPNLPVPTTPYRYDGAVISAQNLIGFNIIGY